MAWIHQIGQWIAMALVAVVLICGSLLLGMIWAAFWGLL
jgi:hypothetical protein